MGEESRAFTVESFTAGDGYVWQYRRYAPAGTPRAHVVCLHGIQSHGGWYEYSCTKLSQAGFIVSFLDRRGSGLNQAERGHAQGYVRLLEDVAEYLHHLRSTNAEGRYAIPVFLAAISWGGKLAVALQRRQPEQIDGLALIGPGFFPRLRPSLRQRVGIVLSRLFSPRRRFLIPLTDPELFTESPKWREFIKQDPLALHRASACFLVESARLDRYIRKAPKFIRVPDLAEVPYPVKMEPNLVVEFYA